MLDRSRRLAVVALLLASACSSESGGATARLVSWAPPAVGDGAVREGGFSDLTTDPSDPSGKTLFAISDRGPNDAKGGVALFPRPAYHQKISRWRLDVDGTVRALSFDSIRDGRGRWTNGLPTPLFPHTERAFALGEGGERKPLEADSAGFDFEGLASDGADGFWTTEEYGPRLLHLRRDSIGYRIDRVLSPGDGLPKVFARRELNKGLEALCRTPGGKIVASFQGALDNAYKTGPKDISERSLARRVLVFDPTSGAVKEFLVQVDDDPEGKTSRRTKTGACAALDERRVIFLEHRKKGKGAVQVDLVRIDLSQAQDIHIGADSLGRGRLVEGRTLEEVALTRDGLAQAGIRTAARTVVASDITRSVGGKIPKPEGLALLGDSSFVVVFDNDFGIEGDHASRFLWGRLPKETK